MAKEIIIIAVSLLILTAFSGCLDAEARTILVPLETVDVNATGDSNFENVGVSGNIYGLGFGMFNQGLLSMGSTTGFTIPSGTGVRLMYIPNKLGALRAGYAAGSEWDSGNIGIYSVGMGYECEASGAGSICIGSDSTVSNTTAASIGSGNTVSGNTSVAIGSSHTITGTGSVALARNNDAPGDFCVVGGELSEADGVATIAMGLGAKTYDFSGGGTIAFGFHAEAWGQGSAAMGNYTKAHGKGTISLGNDTNATGDAAIAIGDNCGAETANAICFGKDLNAYNANQVVMQDLNVLGDANLSSITATKYYGDGSDLTGISAGAADTTLDSNATAETSWLGKPHAATGDWNFANLEANKIFMGTQPDQLTIGNYKLYQDSIDSYLVIDGGNYVIVEDAALEVHDRVNVGIDSCGLDASGDGINVVCRASAGVVNASEADIDGVSGDGTGKVVCVKADGRLGTCSNAPNASGVCTCG